MTKFAEDFLEVTEDKAFDLNHRRVINYNIAKYDVAVVQYIRLNRFLKPQKARS